MSKDLFALACSKINGNTGYGTIVLKYGIKHEVNQLRVAPKLPGIAQGTTASQRDGKAWQVYFDIGDLLSFTIHEPINVGREDEHTED